MKISLRRRHAQIVQDGAFINLLCYIYVGDSKSQRASKAHYWFKSYGYLLNGWILPIGGASAPEGQQSTELPRLVV